MELHPPAVALALGARPLSAVDPHLVVLGVLVAAWVIDKVLAAVEWWRGALGDGTDEGPASGPGTAETVGDPGGSTRETGGTAGDPGRHAGAE